MWNLIALLTYYLLNNNHNVVKAYNSALVSRNNLYAKESCIIYCYSADMQGFLISKVGNKSSKFPCCYPNVLEQRF